MILSHEDLQECVDSKDGKPVCEDKKIFKKTLGLTINPRVTKHLGNAITLLEPCTQYSGYVEDVTQKYGVDYLEILSLLVRYCTMSLLVSLTSEHVMEVNNMDV